MNIETQSISAEQYKASVIALLELERMGCGGSRTAAEVLLSLYNGSAFQVDLASLACNLDNNYFNHAILAICGRANTFTEPHSLIKGGKKIFDQLYSDWKHLHVSVRKER